MSLHKASAEDAFRSAGGTSNGSDHHEMQPARKSVDAARRRDSAAIYHSLSCQVSENHAGNRTEHGHYARPTSPDLNVEDRMSFPTLSTAALHSALPKWKRSERGALRSLVLSEADDVSAANIQLLPETSSSASRWSNLITDGFIFAGVAKESAQDHNVGKLDLEKARPVGSGSESQISWDVLDGRISLKASSEPDTAQSPVAGCCVIQKSSSQPLYTTMDQTPNVHQDVALQAEDFIRCDITQLTARSVTSDEQSLANNLNSAKKSLNVDSPSFTPAQLQLGSKKSTFSSLANAAPFTPKGVSNCKLPFHQILLHANHLVSYDSRCIPRCRLAFSQPCYCSRVYASVTKLRPEHGFCH